MAFVDEVIKRARDHDAARPRSRQVHVGWSEVGGCRAALGFRLDGAWESDETDSWAAQRGTAIHEYLEPILAEPGVRTEVDTEYRGIPGHADLVGPDWIGDIKTKTLANAKTWQDKPSAMHQALVQVHGYAAGLVDAGELPEDCTVRILVIPVDGTFADWWCYEEPFDRSLADEGADRLEAVRAMLAAGEPLPKDKPYAFCVSYCRFFSLCRDTGEERAQATISDPEMAAQVARYGEINAIISPLEREKKALAGSIRGLRGVTEDGWRISLGEPGDGKTGLDEDQIRADYAARGEDVPEVMKPGASPKLTVTRPKAKGVA